MSGFSWVIRSPDGAQASGTGEYLVAPTTRGAIGIMAGHAALLACLVPGELRVSSSGATRSWRVGAGLLEVRADALTILLDAAPVPVSAPAP